MRILLTGAAWFVASSMIPFLLKKWHSIVGIDNFLLGKKEHIAPYLGDPNFSFVEEDLLNLDKIAPHFQWIDLVIHLAANSDISKGASITDIDLNLGTIATYRVLESARLAQVKKIIFASSSAVYGLAKKVPTAEDDGPVLPISLYGASKLACEGLISAFCHNYGMQAWIYRFGNVIGRNSTHGAAFDFVHRLKTDSTMLRILGDGQQAKPYIYVDDLIRGIWHGFEHSSDEVNYFNLSPAGQTNVDAIAKSIVEHMGLSNVRFEYTGGKQGWKGDVPRVEFDTSKLSSLGWRPEYSSDEAVHQGTKDIVDQIFFDKEVLCKW